MSQAEVLWSRSDLERRLGNSLAIAKGAIPLLAVAPQSGSEAPPSFRREKFICETALLVYAASSPAMESRGLQQALREVVDAIVPFARSDELLTMMRLRPGAAIELCVAHVCLARVGNPDPRFQSELESIMDASVARMLERVPWKDIESAWLGSIGGPSLDLDVEDTMLRTTVTKGLDALTALREETYAFTHGLIYLTDFGQQPRPLSRSTDELTADADVAMARALDDDDFDLAAEVLLTWPDLRAPRTPTAVFGLSVLARLEDELGFLPSLTLRQEQYAGLTEPDRRRYVVSEGYHTAYVMGLLSAALLLPDCSPTTIQPDGEAGRVYVGAARALRDLLPARDPIPRWEADFGRLSSREQDAVAPFLATVALRRSVLGSDFRRLRSILSACLAYNLPISPAIYQASEMLGRLVRDDRVS